MDYSVDGKLLRLNTYTPPNTKVEPEEPSKVGLHYYRLDKMAELNDGDLGLVIDMEWNTRSCIVGAKTWGIWSPISEGADVNSIAVGKKSNLLVTGDDYSMVKLFRYPAN